MKQKSIKFNYIMSVLLTASNIIFPLITFPYVSRILKPEGTGLVAFANSIVTYFSMFTQLGIPTYGIRETAKYRNDRERLSQFVQEMLFINFVTSIISYLSYFILICVNGEIRTYYPLYLIMGVSIALNSFGMEWLYKGLEQYQYITVRSLIFKIIALICTFLLVRSSNDIYLYGALTIFAAAGSNIFNILHAHKYIDFKITHKLSIKSHIKAMFVFFFMSVATTIYTNLDNVMLGFMSGNYAVGLYNAASKIKTVLVVLVTSLGTVLLPREAYYVSTGEYVRFYQYIRKAIHFTVIIAVPMLFYFMIFSKDVILVLSGRDYEGAVSSVIILMPTLLFIGLSNILGMQMLVPLGREKQVLISVVSGAIVDFIINLVLIPLLGATAAAFGTTVAELIVFLVQYNWNKKELKENRVFVGKNDFIAYISSIFAVIICYVSVIGISVPLLRLIISWTVMIIIYVFFLFLCKESVAKQALDLLKSDMK